MNKADNIKLSMDKNGNKVLRYIPGKGERGFSVQTLQNLPLTHNMMLCISDLEKGTALNELQCYIGEFGTEHQKKLVAMILGRKGSNPGNKMLICIGTYDGVFED